MTAQRREENIQDVPISISAYSGETMDALGINDAQSMREGDQDLLNGSARWSLDWFDLKLLGSKQKVETKRSSVDFDASPMPLVGVVSPRQFTDSWNAEFQISSNKTSWQNERCQWIFGGYYLDSKGGYDPVILGVGAELAQLLIDNVLPVTLPQQLVDLLSVPNTPLGSEGLEVKIYGALGTKSASAYGQGTWFATDWLDFTFGGRYQKEMRIEVAGNGYYSSGFFWNPANSIKEPAYFTLAARLGYIYLPWQLRITAFGQNLTDERYHLSQSELDFGHLSTLAYPLWRSAELDVLINVRHAYVLTQMRRIVAKDRYPWT